MFCFQSFKGISIDLPTLHSPAKEADFWTKVYIPSLWDFYLFMFNHLSHSYLYLQIFGACSARFNYLYIYILDLLLIPCGSIISSFHPEKFKKFFYLYWPKRINFIKLLIYMVQSISAPNIICNPVLATLAICIIRVNKLLVFQIAC